MKFSRETFCGGLCHRTKLVQYSQKTFVVLLKTAELKHISLAQRIFPVYRSVCVSVYSILSIGMLYVFIVDLL